MSHLKFLTIAVVLIGKKVSVSLKLRREPSLFQKIQALLPNGRLIILVLRSISVPCMFL